MDYRDKKPRYKGICPVCGKTNWICKSIADMCNVPEEKVIPISRLEYETYADE